MSKPQLQASFVAVSAAITTIIVTLVPAWGDRAQIVVGSVGAILTAVLPLVHVGHAAAAAVENVPQVIVKDSPAKTVAVVTPLPVAPAPASVVPGPGTDVT